MPADLDQLLHRAAAGPEPTLDVTKVISRGRRRRRLRAGAITAAVATAVGAVAITAALVAPTPIPVVGPAPKPTPAATATTSDDPGDPAWLGDIDTPQIDAGAAAELVSCEYGIHMGGLTAEMGPFGGGMPDAQGALHAMLSEWWVQLPTTGYQRATTDDGKVVFTHDVGGRARVAVVVADAANPRADVPVQLGWEVEAFAACDPAEFSAATDDQLHVQVWTDSAGRRVPTSVLASSMGPEHCDWDTVRFLRFGGRQYVRDPSGLLSESVVAPYAPRADLPRDATDTGHRHAGEQLWLSGDTDIAYVVDGDDIEAWPATTIRVLCM